MDIYMELWEDPIVSWESKGHTYVQDQVYIPRKYLRRSTSLSLADHEPLLHQEVEDKVVL